MTVCLVVSRETIIPDGYRMGRARGGKRDAGRNVPIIWPYVPRVANEIAPRCVGSI